MNRLPALPLHLAQSLAAYPALLWLHEEPSNALSLPTWAIHVSSVAEWAVAMALIRRMADVTKNPAWTGLSWGMVPSLGSAMCAVTWHLFYNAPALEWLVELQALLTLLGNFTLLWAAYRLYKVQSVRP